MNQQPPYGQPPHYHTTQPLHYRGWVLAALVLGYLTSLALVFIEIAVTSGTYSSSDTSSSGSSSPGILGSVAVILLLALHGVIFIQDGRTFFTLYGKLQWRHMKGWLKVVLVFAYLGVIVMPAIYLVLALQYFLRVRQQTFGQAVRSGWLWYRAKTGKTQIIAAICSLLLVVAFLAFTSFAALADRASALALLTPTPTPGQTLLTTNGATAPSPSNLVTAISATALPTTTVQPTVTPKPVATVKPTPKPKPTQPSVRPTPIPTKCQGVNGNPWCYDFSSGNLISYPPSNFCSYFACIANFWGADDPGDGYVVQCADGSYSQSGGERGACSYHGGVSRPLYAH